METIHERIRRLRQNAQLTQDQLAEAVGVTRQAVQKWESDKPSQTAPRRRVQRLLAEVLGVSVVELMHDDASQSPTPTLPNMVGLSENNPQHSSYFQHITLESMRHDVPIVTMESIMDGQPAQAPGAQRVVVAEGIPGDFFVAAEDDSMANGRNMSIRRGALMLISTDAAPVSGKTYLVAFSGGGRPVPRELEITGPLISLRTSPDASALPMPEGARIVGRVTQVVQIDA